MQRAASNWLCMSFYGLCLFASLANADWPQWGGSSTRNNVAQETGLASSWQPGTFDRTTGRWDSTKAENVKWVAELGSQTYGTPVVAGGRVFVGTNNSAAHLKRFPADIDLGCLLCFQESDGKFLWQFTAEKLPTGRVHDWPLMGIASSPLVEEDRAWFVSNRGEVVCLDTHGFYDAEDDGPVVDEDLVLLHHFNWQDSPDTLTPLCASLDKGNLPQDLRTGLEKAGEKLDQDITIQVVKPGSRWKLGIGEGKSRREYVIRRDIRHLRVVRPLTVADRSEADVVWRFDMMARLGSSQHNLASCSITSWGDTLFVCTGNGVADDHVTIPAPDAPSFFAMHKHSGKVLWTSNLPGRNIHHAQWSAPAVGILGGVPQVVFGGGDGWIYSFHAEQWQNSRPQLLWKFDANAKDAFLELGGRSTRHEPIAPPVLFDNKVYVTIGQDPEHGEGPACVWCIDATKKLDGSDVSPQLVLDAKDRPVPPRRNIQVQAWHEVKLRVDGLAVELDMNLATQRICDASGFGPKRPPEEVSVKTLIKGASWELVCAAVDPNEKRYIWKRPQVNHAGELEEVYILALPTGERIVDNPNSAVVWKYDSADSNGNGEIDFEEQMHRSISSVVLHDDLAFCVDYAGLLHCLDRKTGKPHWTCDLLASCWQTPLIADGRLFVADEDGDVAMLELSADPIKAGLKSVVEKNGSIVYHPATEVAMPNSIYCNLVATNGTLFITSKDRLFAIAKPSRP